MVVSVSQTLRTDPGVEAHVADVMAVTTVPGPGALDAFTEETLTFSSSSGTDPSAYTVSLTSRSSNSLAKVAGRIRLKTSFLFLAVADEETNDVFFALAPVSIEEVTWEYFLA